MANKASDHLWQLIHCLNRTEKRYFKVTVSHNSPNQGKDLISLFNAIDKQRSYDEAALLKKYTGKKYVNNFALAKNRLYTSLLKQLEQYRSATSIEATVQRHINSAKLLLEKSLYIQALRLLSNTKRLALKHELFNSLYEISQMEKSLHEQRNYTGLTKSSLAEFQSENQRLIEELKLSDELWNFKSNLLFGLYENGKERSLLQVESGDRMMHDLNDRCQKLNLSITNRYMLNLINSAHHFHLGRYAECLPFIESNIELTQKNVDVFGETSSSFVSALTNAINIASRLGLQGKCAAYKVILEKVKPMLHAEKKWSLYFMLASAQYSLLLQEGEYEQAVRLIPSLSEKLDEANGQLSPLRKAQFNFNFLIAYVNVGDYKSALKTSNALINSSDIDQSADIFGMTQLIRIVIHYELGNTDLLRFMFRSVKRYFETRNRLFKFEKVFLDFTRELTKARRPKETSGLFASLAQQLSVLQNDARERNAFEYFDFTGWARKNAA